MKRLKELQEQRGAKLKEAKVVTDLASTEKRNLNADELTKLDQLHGEIDAIDKNLQAEVRQYSLQSQKPVELTPKEERDVGKFDYGIFLRGIRDGRPIEGIEAEMAQEGSEEAQRAGVRARGVTLPRMLIRRRELRDMTATGGTTLQQGGMTIATDKFGLLDDFYNALVLRQGGATVLEGLQGNLDIPRYLKPTASAHKTENASADEASPTTGMLSLSPKRLPGYVEVSDQLLIQSSSAIEAVLRRNLQSQVLALAEAAFLHGAGSTDANGIAGTTGIGTVVGGTNGAAPDWADMVNLETEVSVDNADVGSLHYITNQKVRGKLKQTAKVASTDSRMIWDDGNTINGYVPLVTNAVSSALTKGTSSVASAIFFGNLQDYFMAFWSGLSFEMIRDSTLAKTGLTALHFTMYYDGGVVRAESFSAMLDALTA